MSTAPSADQPTSRSDRGTGRRRTVSRALTATAGLTLAVGLVPGGGPLGPAMAATGTVTGAPTTTAGATYGITTSAPAPTTAVGTTGAGTVSDTRQPTTSSPVSTTSRSSARVFSTNFSGGEAGNWSGPGLTTSLSTEGSSTGTTALKVDGVTTFGRGVSTQVPGSALTNPTGWYQVAATVRVPGADRVVFEVLFDGQSIAEFPVEPGSNASIISSYVDLFAARSQPDDPPAAATLTIRPIRWCRQDPASPPPSFSLELATVDAVNTAPVNWPSAGSIVKECLNAWPEPAPAPEYDPDHPFEPVQSFDFNPGDPFPVTAFGDANVAQAGIAQGTMDGGSAFVGWHDRWVGGGAYVHVDTTDLVPGWWYDVNLSYMMSGGDVFRTIDGTDLYWWDITPYEALKGVAPAGSWTGATFHFRYEGQLDLRLPFAYMDPLATACGHRNKPPTMVYVDSLKVSLSPGQMPLTGSTPSAWCETPTTTTAPTDGGGIGGGGSTTSTTTSTTRGITYTSTTPPTTATSTPTTTAPTTALPTTTTRTRPTPPHPTRTRPSPTKPPAPHCEAAYTVAAAWPGHYLANVEVSATTPINGWTTTWAVRGDETLESAWWAVASRTSTGITASNTRWNGRLPAGGKAYFSLMVGTPGPALAPLGTCTAR